MTKSYPTDKLPSFLLDIRYKEEENNNAKS